MRRIVPMYLALLMVVALLPSLAMAISPGSAPPTMVPSFTDGQLMASQHGFVAMLDVEVNKGNYTTVQRNGGHFVLKTPMNMAASLVLGSGHSLVVYLDTDTDAVAMRSAVNVAANVTALRNGGHSVLKTPMSIVSSMALTTVPGMMAPCSTA